MLVGVALGQQLPAAPSATSRQSMQDAWWTGPLLANSANTLPRGHFLVEPYVYDVIGPHIHAFGSRAYIEYGLIDRLTVGMIPIVGYNKVGNGPSSSGIQVGDVTGKYDQLGTRPSDGLGTGSYATTLALNSQTYFWLLNGRILRMRFNVAETIPSGVDVKDVSVYGTTTGFRGHAEPGRYLLIDAAWEYSVTRQWVLALDGIYQHNGNTIVRGTQSGSGVQTDSGSSWAYGFAPAVEYNLSPKVGVILGVRVIVPGRNASFTVASVMAVNIFH
jgi:hypothetical protein